MCIKSYKHIKVISEQHVYINIEFIFMVVHKYNLVCHVVDDNSMLYFSNNDGDYLTPFDPDDA